MIAYRVRIIGSNDHYLITNSQRPDIEEAMDQGGTSIVRIGGNVIRANSIRSLTEVSVDLDSCPAYFQKQVQIEQGTAKRPVGQNYRRLPTKWIILGDNEKMLSDNISIGEVKRISEAFLSTKKENEAIKCFMLAKCHYAVGIDGEVQFHTKTEEIPEALLCEPDETYPQQPPIVGIFRYGILQK